MAAPLARLRGVPPGVLCGALLAVVAAANYLDAQYGGAVAAGIGAILTCAFAVLLRGRR